LIGLNRFMRASGRPLINLPKPGAGTRFIEKVAPAKSAMGLGGGREGIGNSGQSPVMALFGRDRRVGECLLLKEERKSGLRGLISVFDPTLTSQSRASEVGF